MSPHDVASSPLTRRAFLLGSGAATLAACTSSSPVTTPASTSSSTSTVGTASTVAASVAPAAGEVEINALGPADFDALRVCRTLPESAAGPFPTIEQLLRRDVTEGYPGHPLRLGLRVVDETCAPVPGAEVEIWHADATGDYSSYTDEGSGKDEGAGTTFLRGFQTSDADGIVEFQTIYPGWYEGRAAHIHLRVRTGEDLVLTAQLYFDEDYTLGVYETGEYAQFGAPDTTWSTDGLADDPANDGTAITLTAAPTSLGSGTLGLANIGIQP